MIGLLLAGTGDWAPAMLRALQAEAGPQTHCAAFAIDQSDSVASARDRLAAALDTVDAGQGVLILSDRAGASATNLARSLAGSRVLAVLAGVNLATVDAVVAARATERDVLRLAEIGRDSGRAGLAVHRLA